MVITIEKLNLQVIALQDRHDKLLEGFGNNVVNFALQYQTNLQQIKAQIDLLHRQINELVKDQKKEEKKKKKTPTSSK